MNTKTPKPGDHIKVKDGEKAPDFDYQLMDGWQGKVISFSQEYNTIEIEWDVQTLLDTPYKYLNDIIKKGHDHETMNLLETDVVIAEERKPSKQDKIKLLAKICWIDFYDEESKDRKYGEIFSEVNMFDEYDVLQKWEDILIENLEFPFETVIAEPERGMLSVGEKIKLLDIEGYDDKYGIFGIGKHDRNAITFPICNLEATDKKSNNYELLRDYVIWFANR